MEQIKADKCAQDLYNGDSRKFWNSVHKISNKKATSHVASVGGATGNFAIADMWRNHFHEVYNSVNDTQHKLAFEHRVQTTAADTFENNHQRCCCCNKQTKERQISWTGWAVHGIFLIWRT